MGVSNTRPARRRTAVVAVALGAVSLVALGLTAIGDAPSATGVTAVPDKVLYVQQTGSSGTYLQYVPGDGSKITKQGITSGGGCATPSPSGPPLLGMSARVFPNGYGGASSTAPVGAYKSRTGVCSIGQAWQIEPNESLTLAVGTNALVAGRTFSRAQLTLARQDKSTATSPPVTVQLITRLAGVAVDTKTLSLPGPNDTTLLADTGLSRTGFDALELRVLSPATAGISVVGPTSTFTFANKLCVDDTIEAASTDGTASTGDVTATLTYVSNSNGSVCKSYTTFSAAVDDGTGARAVDFGTQDTPGARLVMTIDWGLSDKCRPDAAGPEPTCSPTTVDFGGGPSPQTYCTTAAPPATPAWCTTNRSFAYVTVDGVERTHIVEEWSGFGDPKFARR